MSKEFIKYSELNGIGIMDNVINRLMGSNISPLAGPKLLFHTNILLSLLLSVGLEIT
jgi:hypothetical protein